MELVYLWVEEHKNIIGQGFNFSPRFECSYDEEKKELTINENKDYVSIFPENINVTAIVGENGSGKSNIISIISEILFNNTLQKSKFLLLIKVNNTVETLTNINEIKASFDSKEEKDIDYFLYLAKEQYIQEIVDLSPFLKRMTRYTNSSYHENEKTKTFQEYNRFNLINSVIAEILTSKYLNDDFHLTSFMYLPNRIVIKNINFNTIYNNLISDYQNGNSFISENIIEPGMSDKEEDKAFRDARNQSWAIYDDLEQLFENIKDDYHKFLIILYIQEFGSENYHSFSEKEFLVTELNYSNELLSEKDFNYFFQIGERYISSFKEKEKDIYFNQYKEFFEFDFIDRLNRKYSDLSHGEQTIFGQMLNTYYFSKNTNYNNLIFLLDEPDLSLHPVWQKKYLQELISLLKKQSLNSNKEVINYNIVITSHSPFILSDIPKENIIFLKDGKQEKPFKDDEQTFGANIHTLLSHGFFMEDGLMGEFAKNKISDVIKILKKPQLSEDEIKDCKHIISIIGEPILQKTLEHQLNEKLNPNETELQKLEREQKEIQEKIDKLKRENNETN